MIDTYLQLVARLYAAVLPVAAVIDVAVYGGVAVWAARRPPTVHLRRGVVAAAAMATAGLAVDPSWWRAVSAWTVGTVGALVWSQVDTPSTVGVDCQS